VPTRPAGCCCWVTGGVARIAYEWRSAPRRGRWATSMPGWPQRCRPAGRAGRPRPMPTSRGPRSQQPLVAGAGGDVVTLGIFHGCHGGQRHPRGGSQCPLPLPAAAQHAGRRRARVPVVGVTRRRLGGPDRTAALQPLARTHTPRPKSPRVSARSLRTSWLAAPTRRSRALVVSEKTVSVHVSNMLRKTGTGNRVELAQLARLLTSPAHGPRLS
jgi:Bacterial regulatory proteins, luxR family